MMKNIKKLPSIFIAQKIKYFRINLTEEMNDLYKKLRNTISRNKGGHKEMEIYKLKI